MTMPRYIDADKLIEEYKGNILTAQTDYAEGCRDIIEDIKNAPTADVQEVKHAHWIFTDHYGYYHTPIYECSNCQKMVEDNFIHIHKYCLHCGAKMDEEDGEDVNQV